MIRWLPLVVISTALMFSTDSVLGQGWVLTGEVQDAQGNGIADVNLDLFEEGTTTEIALSNDNTDVDGSYAVTIPNAIAAGFYDLVFKSPAGSQFFDGFQASVFIAGNTVVPLTVLESGWFVSGRVVDALGTGLPEVDLQFTDSGGQIFPATNDITDDMGFFDVLVPPETYDIEFRVTPLTPGGPYVPVQLESMMVNSNIDLGDVTFLDGVVLTGKVDDSGGSPVVGADIDVIDPLTGDEVFTPGDNTDALGNFSVLVPEGDWLIEVDPPVGILLVAQLIPFTVQPPPAANDMGTIVLPPGVPVSGTTVDGSAAPVPDVDLDFVISATGVEIVTAHDNADPMGDFSVVVETNTYDIQFKPLFPTGLAPVVLEDVDVPAAVILGDVTLPPGFGITGIVTASGSPVIDVEVTLTETATGDPVFTFGNETDATGQYGIRQVGGTYDVIFTPLPATGLSPVVVTGVVLNADVVIDVSLDPGPPAPPPVTALDCSVASADVTLTWVNGAGDYDSIEVRRNAVLIATLPGSETSHTDGGLADGNYEYSVTAVRSGLASTGASCLVTVDTTPGGSDFIRGDADGSGAFNGLVDALFVLAFQFQGGPPPPCPDAADADDSGVINGLVDGLFTLAFQFQGGPPPPPPFPDAGDDPTDDGLLCP